MIDFRAAIPTSASAIRIDGEEQGPVRITLDAYLTGVQIQELLALRGVEITVSLRAA